jgi:hypothetical protein
MPPSTYCPRGTTPIVARHEVPGKAAFKEPSRRVRYDRAECQLCLTIPHSKFRQSNHRIGAYTCTNHTVPYGTALWGGAVQALRARLRSPVPPGHEDSDAAKHIQSLGYALQAVCPAMGASTCRALAFPFAHAR